MVLTFGRDGCRIYRRQCSGGIQCRHCEFLFTLIQMILPCRVSQGLRLSEAKRTVAHCTQVQIFFITIPDQMSMARPHDFSLLSPAIGGSLQRQMNASPSSLARRLLSCPLTPSRSHVTPARCSRAGKNAVHLISVPAFAPSAAERGTLAMSIISVKSRSTTTPPHKTNRRAHVPIVEPFFSISSRSACRSPLTVDGATPGCLDGLSLLSGAVVQVL
jgi:hypothetical protein